MKYFFLILFLLSALTSPTPINAKSIEERNECPGIWELKYYNGWFATNKKGTTLQTSPETVIVNCNGEITALTPDLNGANILIDCSPQSDENSSLSIKRINIICR